MKSTSVELPRVFSDFQTFIEFFINLQSLKWALIGVAFYLFRFKRDGKRTILKYWYEVLFIFSAVYIGAPICILHGIPEQYLPVLAAIVGYAGIDSTVSAVQKVITKVFDIFIDRKLKFKGKDDNDK
ncbi:hypothetical protein CKF54_00955 [Psittacicella hinzii]|uniref:Uncharacterized protein n=1 Tax=Psittacicella hinzii TaxID=2028575 RepID=A0A3A1Y7Z2_9GAMM|nr:hypothetical protein [Psittacicella hinzii]RIY34342.1 hypothetical protein CKF54_00955 [Psittacicella hinzii]